MSKTQKLQEKHDNKEKAALNVVWGILKWYLPSNMAFRIGDAKDHLILDSSDSWTGKEKYLKNRYAGVIYEQRGMLFWKEEVPIMHIGAVSPGLQDYSWHIYFDKVGDFHRDLAKDFGDYIKRHGNKIKGDIDGKKVKVHINKVSHYPKEGSE